MDTNKQRVVCAGCGREYRWKPELAGKGAKCKCGGKVHFSAESPEAAGNELELQPAASPEAMVRRNSGMQPGTGLSCPVCNEVVPTGAVLCTACGTNLKTGKRLGVTVEREAPGAELKPAKRRIRVPGWVWGILVIVIMAGLALLAIKLYPRQVREYSFYVAWTGVIIAAAAARLGSLESSDYGGLAVAGRFIPPLWFFALLAQAVTDFEQVRLWFFLMLIGIGVAVVGFWAMSSPMLGN